jgi:hypothetical protein
MRNLPVQPGRFSRNISRFKGEMFLMKEMEMPCAGYLRHLLKNGRLDLFGSSVFDASRADETRSRNSLSLRNVKFSYKEGLIPPVSGIHLRRTTGRYCLLILNR